VPVRTRLRITPIEVTAQHARDDEGNDMDAASPSTTAIVIERR
jgi:hypothetical protein